MMKSVFVMWQDLADTRMWHPVAKLTQKSEDSYCFNYTAGSNHKHFGCFPSMEDKTKLYESNKLFTFFKNRLVPESRPEHDSLFEWSGLSPESKDYIELLAISGGERKTDHFRIVNIPVEREGFYIVRFFVSSLNYLTQDERESIKTLQENDALKFESDTTNTVDSDAMILLKDSELRVGYMPHYLCQDLKQLLRFNEKSEIEIKVAKVNLEAPAQFRLLCEIKAPWKEGFKPFDNSEFEDF